MKPVVVVSDPVLGDGRDIVRDAPVPDVQGPSARISPAEPDATPDPAPDGGSGTLIGRRPRSRPAGQRRLVATVAFVVIAGAAVAGYRYGLPHDVETLAVLPAPLTVTLSGPGTIDAIDKATISARVQGRISELAVDRNDHVEKGAVIARIGSDDVRNRLAAAVATEAASRRAVEQAEADRARVEATLANARTAFDRQARLKDDGWTTQASYDAALATLRQAEADLTRSKAAIAAARAQQQSSAASVEVARADLADTVLTAPFDGVVVSRARAMGDILTPGSPVVELVDPETLVLTARFDESAIARIEPGLKAELHFPSEPNRAIAGHVFRLGREVDTETREFTVDVAMDVLPRNWAIGQRGTAVIDLAVTDAVLAVPGRFIARRDGQAGLWVVEDGRARWRPVVLGRSGGDRVEIRSGLAAGDRVVAPDGAYPFMRVRIATEDRP